MNQTGLRLTSEAASSFARIVLAGIHREYPNKLDHVLDGADSVRSPRELHPAFFGCFDWHSAVHGHWLLARLSRLMPGLPEISAIRAALGRSLTAENIAAETAYLARPLAAGFERTYGWAWLLKLAEELGRGESIDAQAWFAAIQPLAHAFVERYLRYLPRADYPLRLGVHPNTAFGLAFAHDYAVFAGHDELRALVERKAIEFFTADTEYPAQLEPGGADFFSAALMEADLMRRIWPVERFAAWLTTFLPRAGLAQPRSLFSPARVNDRSDLQIVHLDGLNLSRAWCMRNIAAALPETDPRHSALLRSADAHTAASLPHVCSGHYGGEHWLATFAMLALTGHS